MNDHQAIQGIVRLSGVELRRWDDCPSIRKQSRSELAVEAGAFDGEATATSEEVARKVRS